MANPSERGGQNPPTPGHPRMNAGHPTSTRGPAPTVAGMAGQVKEAVQGAASAVGGRVGDALESTRGTLRQGEQWVERTAGDLWDDLSGAIRRNPVGAVALAFGLGCLVTCCVVAWSSREDDVAERMSRASA